MVQVTCGKWAVAALLLVLGMSIPGKAQENSCGQYGRCAPPLTFQLPNLFGCYFYNLFVFGGSCNTQPTTTCQCVCLNGFSQDAGGNCVDINECAVGIPSGLGSNLQVCVGDICVNTVGGYYCTPDLDECTLGTNNCAENATCTNTVGSFSCSCLPGFSGNGTACDNVDECSLGTDNCAENATCTDTVGSFSCSCLPGFTGDGTTCNDVDECSLGTDNCAENATCTNTVGSFSCSCLPGFTGDGIKCNDLDECSLGTDNCAENATCKDTVGSFSCSCLPGFTGNGTTCNDVDECSLGTDNCAENATCTDTVGSFSCSCLPGFTGNGTKCNNLDECSLGTDNCAENATCKDTVGSFSCSCLPGFTGDGQTCNDVDECSLGTDNCAENATCTDTVGSFSCSCLPFFTGDGITCVDTRTCPGGPPGSEFWVKSSDGTKCFQFFSDQLDYAGAKAQCVTNVTGSTLAIILSESQNSDVEGLIPDVTTSVKNWIGLEQSTPGTWAWLDSTSTAGYINWDGNNGGTAPSNADKACGAINNKQIKKWKEQTCSEPGQYICEVILP